RPTYIKGPYVANISFTLITQHNRLIFWGGFLWRHYGIRFFSTGIFERMAKEKINCIIKKSLTDGTHYYVKQSWATCVDTKTLRCISRRRVSKKCHRLPVC